jgi:transposase
MKDMQSLPDDPVELKKIIAELTAKNAYLEEQFRLAMQRAYGSKAESHPAQGELFNEAESLDEQEVAEVEEDKQHISYSRKKPVRQSLPEGLPRERVVHDISDEDKVCDCCGGDLHPMGENISEQLEYIPAKVKVIEHVRPKYSCRHCEQTGTEVNIKQAPVPATPIPKSFATPSLLAQIISHKFHYALPLYRQESIFKQHGIELSYKTMSSWVLRCAELLKPVYEKLHSELLKQGVIQADETPIKVINADKAKCYMWLYCTGSDSPQPNSDIPNIVLYDYQASRAGACVINYLDDYQGYLQCDGYAGYEQTQATLVGCFAHARRKFIEAQKVQVKGKSGKADMVLNLIQKLYAIERNIKDKTITEKHQARQTKALPIIKKLKTYLDKIAVNTLPKSKLGEAISYALNQWSKLIRYLEDGNLTIDNNRAERAIKPFVIGRKNWMFAKTNKGATASSILYSLVETAKANNLMPFDYLHHILKELPTRHTDTPIDDLLPWNISL